MCKSIGNISQLETRPLIGWPARSTNQEAWFPIDLCFQLTCTCSGPRFPWMKESVNHKIVKKEVQFIVYSVVQVVVVDICQSKHASISPQCINRQSWKIYQHCLFTPPNFRVCSRRKVPVKRFKICHVLYLQKPKVAFSIFHFVLLYFFPN